MRSRPNKKMDYDVLSRSMDPKTLKQVQEAIAARRTTIPPDEARDLAKRAVKFKKERGRLPDRPDRYSPRPTMSSNRLAGMALNPARFTCCGAILTIPSSSRTVSSSTR